MTLPLDTVHLFSLARSLCIFLISFVQVFIAFSFSLHFGPWVLFVVVFKCPQVDQALRSSLRDHFGTLFLY